MSVGVSLRSVSNFTEIKDGWSDVAEEGGCDAVCSRYQRACFRTD